MRKLTLNGAEDIPVAAGDTVFVGPGVYREKLSIDVSGILGSPITYVADTSGENTDSVGGIVRVTGSDNDQSAARGSCIKDEGVQRNYRTFRGFQFDTTSATMIDANNACTNWIIEDCTFENGANQIGIYVNGANQSDWTIRRCTFHGPSARSSSYAIRFNHNIDLSNIGHTIENCRIEGSIVTGKPFT